MIGIYRKFMDRGAVADAYSALQIIWNETKNYKLVCEYRKKLTKMTKKDSSPELLQLVRNSWFISSREKFRDYLVAVEWDRPYTSKFFLPRACYLDRIGIVDAYQQVFDGKLDILTNSLPKRAGKSQLEINFVDFISGNFPLKSSLIEGSGDALIDSFYKGCLEYLQDPQYSYFEIFPRELANQNAKQHTINLDEDSRFPTIMCRSIDATQVGLSEATNVLVLDDCVSGREEAKNRALLDKKWEILNGDILGRAIEGTPIIASGTRYSLYDPIGHIQDMAREKGLRMRVIEVPALDFKTDESNYEYYNPKLGRKVFTTQYFKNERKSLTAEAFESEFQQRPFEAKGLLLPKTELNYFFELPADVDPDYIMAVGDTAEGGGDSVSMPILYIYGEDVFVADWVFDDATPEFTKPECAKALFNHKVGSATFESNLAGTAFAKDVEELLKGMGGRCSIKTKRTVTNKATRIELASDYVIKHFYFKHESTYEPNSQYGRAMREMTTHTRTGKVTHDDAIDSISLAVTELKAVTTTTVSVKKRFW